MLFTPKPKRIYLDYASATPVHHEVKKAMEPYFSEIFGNAGAIHTEGVQARTAIEHSRDVLAKVLRIRPQGIVFTGSGTESNNLAIMGTVEARASQGVAYADMEIISTAIEHASVMEVLAHLQKKGVKVVHIPLTEEGIIDVQAIPGLINVKTILVTLSLVNSEIGIIQPIGKVSRIAKAAEKEFSTRIYVHVDGAQAPLWHHCGLDTVSCDILSLDAGKCYGPKGVGVLAFVHGVALSPYLFGGAQEGGVRPGTENTALIVGATKAIVLAQEGHIQRVLCVQMLRDKFMLLLGEIEGLVINGSQEHRVANNVNISIPGIDSEFAVISLDEKGIACSTKSACGGAKGDGSAVVLAITRSAERATSTIRFTLGEDTTLTELSLTADTLKKHVASMRSAFQKIQKN